MIATWLLIVYYINTDYAYKEHEYKTQAECVEDKKRFQNVTPWPKLAITDRIFICVDN